jgi:ribosomal protein L34
MCVARQYNVPVYTHKTNIIRVINARRLRQAGYVAQMGARRGAHMLSVRKSEGRRPLERPRHRCEDNMKMDL